MAGSRKKKGKDEDFGELQARMTRAILTELRNDIEDLLAGLDAGSIGYVLALKALKIQFLEGLKDPLVGAVDVNYTKMMIPIDKIDVPPALKKKRSRGGSRRSETLESTPVDPNGFSTIALHWRMMTVPSRAAPFLAGQVRTPR